MIGDGLLADIRDPERGPFVRMWAFQHSWDLVQQLVFREDPLKRESIAVVLGRWDDWTKRGLTATTIGLTDLIAFLLPSWRIRDKHGHVRYGEIVAACERTPETIIDLIEAAVESRDSRWTTNKHDRDLIGVVSVTGMAHPREMQLVGEDGKVWFDGLGKVICNILGTDGESGIVVTEPDGRLSLIASTAPLPENAPPNIPMPNLIEMPLHEGPRYQVTETQAMKAIIDVIKNQHHVTTPGSAFGVV